MRSTCKLDPVVGGLFGLIGGSLVLALSNYQGPNGAVVLLGCTLAGTGAAIAPDALLKISGSLSKSRDPALAALGTATQVAGAAMAIEREARCR